MSHEQCKRCWIKKKKKKRKCKNYNFYPNAFLVDKFKSQFSFKKKKPLAKQDINKKQKQKKSFTYLFSLLILHLLILSNFRFSYQTCSIRKLKPLSSFDLTLKSLTLQSHSHSFSLKAYLLQNKKFQKVDAAKVIPIYLKKKNQESHFNLLFFTSLSFHWVLGWI